MVEKFSRGRYIQPKMENRTQSYIMLILCSGIAGAECIEETVASKWLSAMTAKQF